MEIAMLPYELMAALSADERLADVELIREYPGRETAFIRHKSLVTVGVSAFEVAQPGISGYLGRFENNGAKEEYFGRKLSVDYILTVFCPQNLGGEGCSNIFLNISSVLIDNAAGLWVKSIRAGQTEYNPNLDTYTLKITLTAEYFAANIPDKSDDVRSVTVIKNEENEIE